MFVKQNITYQRFQPLHKSAVEVLKAGKGDCVDQATLTASLLIAAGYPSESLYVVLGTVNEPYYMESIPPENHAWVEFNYQDEALILDPTSYLGNFTFNQWTKEKFYNAFRIDDYFAFNDRSSWIVKKHTNRFLE